MIKRPPLPRTGARNQAKWSSSSSVKEGLSVPPAVAGGSRRDSASRNPKFEILLHSLRGKFKGKGLLKALMVEKQKER
jgi:hypothetical protein